MYLIIKAGMQRVFKLMQRENYSERESYRESDIFCGCRERFHSPLLRNVQQLVGSHLSWLTMMIKSVKTAHWQQCFFTPSLYSHTLKSAAIAHQFHTSLAVCIFIVLRCSIQINSRLSQKKKPSSQIFDVVQTSFQASLIAREKATLWR